MLSSFLVFYKIVQIITIDWETIVIVFFLINLKLNEIRLLFIFKF